jgi:hypothetical protein
MSTMARIVGTQDRTEFIVDPVQALRRGAVLDRMGTALLPRHASGVVRAPHKVFNALDDLRQLELARRLNVAKSAP